VDLGEGGGGLHLQEEDLLLVDEDHLPLEEGAGQEGDQGPQQGVQGALQLGLHEVDQEVQLGADVTPLQVVPTHLGKHCLSIMIRASSIFDVSLLEMHQC